MTSADSLVWLPIIIFIVLILVFFLFIGARWMIWKYTPEKTIVEEGIVEHDEEKGDEEDAAVKHVSDTEKTIEEDTLHTENKKQLTTAAIHKKPLPDELAVMMYQQQMIPNPKQRVDELSPKNQRIVTSIVKKYSDSEKKSDVEALEMFSLLPGMMDPSSAILAATSLRYRGFPVAAVRLLVDDSSEDVLELKTTLAAAQAEEWKNSQGHMLLHYAKFWKGRELRMVVGSCLKSLKERVHVHTTRTTIASDHDHNSKLGIKGMVQDGHGTFTEEEQNKAKSIMAQLRDEVPTVLPDVYTIYETSENHASLFENRLFRGHSCKLPFVRFVRVDAILQMEKTLTKFEDMASESFVKQGKFAVSFGCSSPEQADESGDNMLKRLKHVLHNLDGVRPDDGVYIDWCCCFSAPMRDSLNGLMTKAIFQHCHVIFLPDADFFERPMCVYQYMTWLQSPFPNQAIGDYDLCPAFIRLVNSFYGRPPYLLDRPELASLGSQCMTHTRKNQFNKIDRADFLGKIQHETQVQQYSLEELLTKIIFKLESTVLIV
ncbi:MAG: hypothetical protein SGILL_003255 [Bacillariaceae sp.]